jgi:hypothetical protein
VPAALNDRFYPILLSRTDEPVTDAELDAFFTKLAMLADEGIRKGERYVVIVLNDPTKFSPAGRRKVAEMQAHYVTPRRNDVTLAAFIPIDNAFVRGAVTALRWVSPDIVKSVQFVPTVDAALREALATLEANGTPFTGDLPALRRALATGVA